MLGASSDDRRRRNAFYGCCPLHGDVVSERRCAMCGRAMKRPEGAVSSPVDPTINLCHPDDETLPDCYHLYTVYHRPLTWLEAQRSTPPVPPVVPDSEALDRGEFCPRCQGETETGTFGYSCACQGHCGKVGCSGALRSGSGVVPDKPALEPCDECGLAPADCRTRQETDNEYCCTSCSHEGSWSPYPLIPRGSIFPGRPKYDASVPAVTDDEAALTLIADAAHAACPPISNTWLESSETAEAAAGVRAVRAVSEALAEVAADGHAVFPSLQFSRLFLAKLAEAGYSVGPTT